MTTHPAAEATSHAAARPAGRRTWLALSVLALAQFMLVLDVTVVNVALPDIGAGLHLSGPSLTWVLTAYTVVFGGLMLLGGRLADLFGARRLALAGLALFTAASLASGLAASAPMLIGGRVAQGAGAALLSPAALALVTTMFSGRDRHRALGVWAAIGGAGSAIGVVLGGLLTSAAGWPWVFFSNVPAGVAVLIAVPLLVPASRPQAAAARLDVPGALLVTAATAAAIFGLVSVGSHGWAAPAVLVPLALAATGYAAFALAERRAAVPLMDLRLLARRPVAAGSFLMLVATGLLVGSFFLGSFSLQRGHGFSALATGLLFLPVALAIVAGAHAASHAVTRFDRRALTATALAVAAAGSALAASVPGTAGLVTGMSVAALGLGATFVLATTTALAATAGHAAGVGSGIVSTSHELGGAAGVAVLSSIALAGAGPGLSGAGFTRAFTVSAVSALVAAVLAALTVPRGRAAAAAGPHAH